MLQFGERVKGERKVFSFTFSNLVKYGPCPQFFGRVYFRGRPNLLLLPKIFVWVKGRCQTGRSKANFFDYGQICVGKRGKVLFKGRPNLTPLKKKLFELRKGQKEEGQS